MGRESVRAGKHLCFCLALLILLSGCSLFKDWGDRHDIRESMLQGHNLFMQGDYEQSVHRYRQAILLSRDHAPGDVASYNIGLIHAHPNNPKRSNHKAIESFREVITDYAESPWVEQAEIWVSVLEENENSKRQAEKARGELEKSNQALEKSRQELEKYKQVVEKSKEEVDKTRQEMEKSKKVMEKANQIDIQIEKKKRARGK